METKVFRFPLAEIVTPIANFDGLKAGDHYAVTRYIENHEIFGNCYRLFNLNTGEKIEYPVLFANERFKIWRHDTIQK